MKRASPRITSPVEAAEGDGERLFAFRHAGEEFIVFSAPLAVFAPYSLTPSEQQILAEVARGKSNAAIARGRGTSVRTVANQIAGLLRKTRAGSRAELAWIASR